MYSLPLALIRKVSLHFSRPIDLNLVDALDFNGSQVVMAFMQILACLREEPYKHT